MPAGDARARDPPAPAGRGALRRCGRGGRAHPRRGADLRRRQRPARPGLGAGRRTASAGRGAFRPGAAVAGLARTAWRRPRGPTPSRCGRRTWWRRGNASSGGGRLSASGLVSRGPGTASTRSVSRRRGGAAAHAEPTRQPHTSSAGPAPGEARRRGGRRGRIGQRAARLRCARGRRGRSRLAAYRGAAGGQRRLPAPELAGGPAAAGGEAGAAAGCGARGATTAIARWPTVVGSANPPVGS